MVRFLSRYAQATVTTVMQLWHICHTLVCNFPMNSNNPTHCTPMQPSILSVSHWSASTGAGNGQIVISDFNLHSLILEAWSLMVGVSKTRHTHKTLLVSRFCANRNFSFFIARLRSHQVDSTRSARVQATSLPVSAIYERCHEPYPGAEHDRITSYWPHQSMVNTMFCFVRTT